MKKLIHLSLSLMLLCGITSCNKSEESKQETANEISQEIANSAWNLMSSEAAKFDSTSNRSFLKKADVKFQVNNVRTANFNIEKLIISNGGFITKSYLRTENIRSREIPIANDSVLKLTQFHLVNDIEFRVPTNKLHSVLFDIGEYAKFIDYRIIEAEDKTWNILQNNNYQKRLKTHTQRLENKIKNQKDKITETTDALNQLLSEELATDNKELDQQRLADEISYSTVKINFYEKEQLIKEYEPNNNFYKEYKPAFLTRASLSFTDGITIAENIILFFLKIWPILIIGTLLYYLFKLKGMRANQK